MHGDGSNDRGADEREAYGGDDAAADDDAAERRNGGSEAFQGAGGRGTVEDPLMESVMFGEGGRLGLDLPVVAARRAGAAAILERGSSSDDRGSSDHGAAAIGSRASGEKLLASRPTMTTMTTTVERAPPRQPLAPASGDVSLFGDSADSALRQRYLLRTPPPQQHQRPIARRRRATLLFSNSSRRGRGRPATFRRGAYGRSSDDDESRRPAFGGTAMGGEEGEGEGGRRAGAFFCTGYY